MSPPEIDELAMFYTVLFHQPVSKYVIHLCDSVVCRLDGSESLGDCLFKMPEAGDSDGQKHAGRLVYPLPVCPIGYCDRSPAILISKKAYGR